jgi:hypothetical protein
VSQFSHELHLLHHVPRNVLLLLVVQLLDADDGASVARRLAGRLVQPGLARHY